MVQIFLAFYFSGNQIQNYRCPKIFFNVYSFLSSYVFFNFLEDRKRHTVRYRQKAISHLLAYFTNAFNQGLGPNIQKQPEVNPGLPYKWQEPKYWAITCCFKYSEDSNPLSLSWKTKHFLQGCFKHLPSRIFNSCTRILYKSEKREL